MVRRHIEICDGETYIKTSLSIWAFSSVGQSNRLITGRSRVRVPEGPPFTFLKKRKVNKRKTYVNTYVCAVGCQKLGLLIQGYSSAGRAAVSKTACRGFDPFCPCHMAQQFSWLERQPVTLEVDGSSPFWVAIMLKIEKSSHAAIAQQVERILGKDEVGSSNLPSSSI